MSISWVYVSTFVIILKGESSIKTKYYYLGNVALMKFKERLSQIDFRDVTVTLNLVRKSYLIFSLLVCL